MTPLKQLYRQPIRLTIICIILGMAAYFFCLSAGVLASAKITLDQVEKSYVTIGIPTTETTDVITEYEGMQFHYEKSIITDEMWSYMDQLAAEGTIIKGAYQQNYISAYSSSINTVTSGKEAGSYKSYLDGPYDHAIFVVRVESVETPIQLPWTGQVNVYADASIEEVVALHPDYHIRSKLRLSILCNSQEEYHALDLKSGCRYLVYGTYLDCDLDLRTSLASIFRCNVDEIDLSKLSFDLTEDDLTTAAHDFHPAARYTHGDDVLILGKESVEKVNKCDLLIQNRYGKYPEEQKVVSLDRYDTDVSINDQYLNVFMTRLDADLESFLNSAEGSNWKSVIQEVETQNHSISVIGTDLLESMYSFHQKKNFITEGRSFEEEEYRDGDRVCLISESTAAASGLKIGDTIDLSFYWGPDSLAELTIPEWNLEPMEYSIISGFSSEATTYQIVGIYRQSNLWDTADYSFLPNTVFVPNASLPEETYTRREGALFTYVLENGKISAFQKALSEQGYPESILYCFDNGYTEISKSLQGFFNSSIQLLFVSCLTSVAVLLVYLLLFVKRQKSTMGLMLSLGSGRKSALRFNWIVSATPVFVSMMIGLITGIVTMDGAAQRLYASSLSVMDSSFSGGAIVGDAAILEELVPMPIVVMAAGLILIVVYISVAYFYLHRASKQSARSLIRSV